MQQRIMLLFYFGVMLSVVFIQPVFALMWLLQLLLIAVVGYVAWQSYQQKVVPFDLLLSENGKVELQKQQQWLPYQLLCHSLLSDWFCLLRLKSDSPLDTNNMRYIWLWRDSVDDDSYRRVCRVIARVRHGQVD